MLLFQTEENSAAEGN